MRSVPKERRWSEVAMRSWLLPLVLLMLGACQTAGGNDASAALESARAEAQTASTKPAAPEKQPSRDPVAGEEVHKPAVRDSRDPVLAAVFEIGRLQKVKGTLEAMDVVFRCYERAQDPRASITDAKICAAQDFAVSKSVEEGRAKPLGGQADARSAIIAGRVAHRIGALMQLKGMGQAEFDRFGFYLHQYVKPAHIRALS